MIPFTKNGLVLVTDGYYKGRYFVVKEVLGGDIWSIKCAPLTNQDHEVFYFDGLCAEQIGLIYQNNGHKTQTI